MIVTNSSRGVLGEGLQRDMRSGRGRPTKFLIMSVMRAVSRREMIRPRAVTCALWVSEGLRMRVQRRIMIKGSTPA